MSNRDVWTLSGDAIGIDCAVFVAYLPNDAMRCVLTADTWGDRAVVVDASRCSTHPDCTVLTVAPDDTDTVEYPHASDAVGYPVDRMTP